MMQRLFYSGSFSFSSYYEIQHNLDAYSFLNIKSVLTKCKNVEKNKKWRHIALNLVQSQVGILQ